MVVLCRRPASDKTGCKDLELQEVTANGSLDFDEWTSLVSEIEKLYPDDMEKICLVYDRFLSKFPLCYGYWMKYASHMTHLCTLDKVVEVLERAVQSATYSVDMWVQYCSFGMSAFEDLSDIRRLFKRAISFVGKDYLCHALWDKYIQFEFSQQQWVSLAHIYIQTLKFPTKKLHHYYNSFKKLVAYLEEDIKSHGKISKELQSEPLLEDDIRISCKEDKIYGIIKDMLESSVGLTRLIALKRYKIIGEQLYHDACQLDSKVCSFEANIQRSFFHVRPLDANQLENWHHYLDFVELQGDFDWAVKLYERCLIVCAYYPEYWIRYVEFMETKGGREIANYSLERATDIFLKRVPAIHLFSARFKEQIGDVLAARVAYSESVSETDSELVANVISKANMEKRLGNIEAAFNIYKEALEMAATKENFHNLSILYIHFYRLKYMSTNSVDAARDVLLDGIRNLPHCKLLLEELIKFLMVHGGPVHMVMLDSIIADAISPKPDGSQSLSAADAEDISNLYLEFVDLCGTIGDVRKAWNRHIKLFPNSIRTEIHQKSAKCRRPLDLLNDPRTEACDVRPQQPSGDATSELQVQPPPQDKRFSPQNNQDISSYAPSPEVPLLENASTQFDGTVEPNLQTEADDIAREKGRESPLKVSEKPRDNYPEQHVSSLDLDISQQVSTDFKNRYSKPEVSSDTLVDKQPNGNETLPYSKEIDAYAQNKYELELEREKLPSVETPSLDPHESTAYPDPEIYKSSNRTVPATCNANQENSASTQDSESAQIHVETNSPSSSASHRDHITRRQLKQPEFSRHSGGNWQRMNNSGKFHRNPKFGFRGHAHRKQHQRRWRSPQQHHPAEVGRQMPPTPGYPPQPVSQFQQGGQGQSQYQVRAPYNDSLAAHSWETSNMQLQNCVSQSQMPANHTSSQVSPHLMQGQTQGQYGHMQNEQAYNQMWQYYYYQQQQLQLQQSFKHGQSQQIQQQSQLEHALQQQQQLQLQQQILLQQQQQQLQQQFQQQSSQQQEHPLYLQQLQPLIQVQQGGQELKQHEQSTLSNHNRNQQGQEEKLLQHPSEPGLVSSIPAPPGGESPQEKSQEE